MRVMETLALPPSVEADLPVSSTVLLMLDMTDRICSKRPSCVAGVPAVARLLERARSAGVPVIHTEGSSGPSTFLPSLTPRPDEPVRSARADKFYGTDLADLLEQRGARFVVICGTSANGAVLYTSFGASVRGYTVVVPVDGVSTDLPDVLRFSLWQLLNQPGSANPQNEPLAEQRVTLSTTETIRFVEA